jgi:hypothetical protein
MRDVDQIIEMLKTRHPDVSIEQLKVSHPGADDDGLWFITTPDLPGEIQIESWNGQCPFLIESDFENKQLNSSTVQDTVTKVEALIAFGRSNAKKE